jgi:trimeric autotransporter adhesin
MTTTNSIHDAFINALMADAAYVKLTNINGDPLNAEQLMDLPAFTTRLTPALAQYFVDHFDVVRQIDKDDTLGSGFDATVFRAKDIYGQVYVSMRGTEITPGDLSADADLSVLDVGLATRQVIDMVNWWLRSTSRSIIDLAPQIQLSEEVIPNPIGGTATIRYYISAAQPVLGDSSLLNMGPIVVNGHSLGGHLATAFTRIFGAYSGVQQVNTYNSATFSLASDAWFNQIFDALGWARLPFRGDLQNNFFSMNGLSVTTGDLGAIKLPIGKRIGLFNESTTPSGIDNHYIYKLTDALALGDFLSTLDPTLDMTKLNRIYEGSTTTLDVALEQTIDGLTKILRGLDPHFSLNPSDTDKSDPRRVAFHAYLKDLRESFASLAGKFTIEVTGNADTMSQQARTDFGSFLALNYLTPFVLKTTDAATTASLKAVQGSLATQWADDQTDTAIKQANGTLNFTDHWLEDRAKALAAINEGNQLDHDQITDHGLDSLVIYSDRSTQRSVTATPNVTAGDPLGGLSTTGLGETRKVIFGSDLADSGADIDGGAGEDHLYGGGGADIINGGAGKDYIEGNDGADDLRGDDGNDTLLGQAGADILKGGKGDDKLLGGAGADTYEFATGDGNDTIIDSDGQGDIKIDGITLTGGKRLDATSNIWQSADKQFTYTLVKDSATSDRLLIGRKDKSDCISNSISNSSVVKGFSSEDVTHLHFTNKVFMSGDAMIESWFANAVGTNPRLTLRRGR